MRNVARAFDQQSTTTPLHPLPHGPAQQDNAQLPWGIVASGGMPPLMFQLRFHDGRMMSFAYSDLREIHCRDAGRVELYLQAMAKIVIIIEGRHLRDLAKWLGNAGVLWVQEGDPRDTQTPETAPEVVSIRIEQLPE